MKKQSKFIFLAIAIFLLISIICVVVFLCCNKNNIITESNNIEIKHTEINNQKNNYTANDGISVTQIGDKIYFTSFNYEENQLYEIKSGETRLIYTESIHTPAFGSLRLSNVYKGKILKSADSDTFLNTETGNFVNKFKKYSPTNDDYIAFINDDKRYFGNFNDLYRYDEDKGYSLIATNKDLGKDYIPLDPGTFYLTEPYLYYDKNCDGKIFICRYNTDSKKIIDEVQVLDGKESYDSVTNIIGVQNDVYFIDENTLYCVDLEDGKVEKIFENDGYLSANYYDDKLFISAESGVENDSENDGIYLVDLQDNRSVHKIYNDSISEIYILDDDYVYFVKYTEEDKALLCRLNLDNNKTEIVFEE